jgi:hypothetical protein
MKRITLFLCLSAAIQAAELRIGSSTVSITPDKPVALAGQFGTRISQSVEAPIIAAAVAIESVEGGKVADQSILISCDLVGIHHSVLAQFRQHLKPLLPDFDVRKVIVSATHTHTAPVTSEILEETLITLSDSKGRRHAAGGIHRVSRRAPVTSCCASMEEPQAGWRELDARICANR